MPRCYLGLGGNLGSVSATFRQVFERLTQFECSLDRVSRFYRTPAVGAEAGGDFLNAAAAIDTDLPAETLLDRLQSIEIQLGRVRSVHWGPRTIDVDLLLYGDAVIESPRLTVPHPCCWYRRFVLDPLVEIAAGVVHPVKGITLGDLRQRLLARPFSVGLAGGTGERRSELVVRLAPEFPQVRFFDWETTGAVRSAVPALLFWLGPPDARAAVSPASSAKAGFLALPPLPRLAIPSDANSAADFARFVLQSSLGEPTVTSTE
ncbi:MAG TPA: 2-amino-4-hydroxy-6-hydroxymethyldihydropteridine diphosphokinase [Planctomycetaceae bacterium]|jgi:2-amino-4-hydroxy-6-hydroxymethyldihydropteridine diphosphokinase|nr:2-amino-4-hydroxy-6-hydroxymethyldihydropteridine diphosphokinase [Planctomycetaceae bacterium]